MNNPAPASALQSVTEKIVKVVGTTIYSDCRWDDEGFCFNCGRSMGYDTEKKCERSITLEDVLRAFTFRVKVDNEGWMQTKHHSTSYQWLLGKSLAEQSPETLAFLDSLL